MTDELLWPPYSGPADRARIEEVPIDERGIPATVWEGVQHARAYGDRTALTLLPSGDRWEEPEEWSFTQLCSTIVKAANVFSSLGITRGVPVTIMGVNTGHLLASTIAAQTVGIAAPVNPTLDPEHIVHLVDQVGAKVIVAAGPELHEELWEGACTLAALAGIEHVLALRPDGVDAQAPAPALSVPDGVSVAYLEDLLADHSGDELTAEPPSPDDVANYFHTGGTTGVPKIAGHLHRNVMHMAWTMGMIMDVPVPSTILAGLPLFHVNGLMVTGVMPLLRGHSTVWTGPLGFRDPGLFANMWKIIERYQCTSMSSVPTAYSVLCDVPVDADISTMELPVVGSAPLPRSVAAAWAEHTGVPLCEGYGLTEATTASAFTHQGHQRPPAVGSRLPYQNIKAVDIDADGTWHDLPAGTVGIVAIDGPTIFPGYLRVDDDGRRWLDDSRDVVDGWLNTGDLGYVDDDGYLFLTGRAKDLIIRGGHNIEPAMIEDAMLEHPAVTGAGAVGRPDSHSGEVPVVYVTVNGDVAVEDLERWAADTVPERAAVPKDVYVIDEIPITSVGKPFKPALREDAYVRLIVGDLADAGVDVSVEDVAARHVSGELLATITVDADDVEAVGAVTGRYQVPVTVEVAQRP